MYRTYGTSICLAQIAYRCFGPTGLGFGKKQLQFFPRVPEFFFKIEDLVAIQF